ncbi:MAG TPA: hypothetical protein VMZ71_01915 [Gemmataceae bacterium]|nr:hypothetical protein [Gemmataceae bacterium]
MGGGRDTATTASSNRVVAVVFSLPTDRTSKAALAVKSFPGRAKLATSNPPVAKSGASRRIALGSPYGLLVI